MTITLRTMQPTDYDQLYALWTRIKGFGIRSIDDTQENVTRFLRRNPDTSVVALAGERIVGGILCGHDGRQGSFYHVCVDPNYRRQGIGKRMVVFAMEALKREQINKITLVAYTRNDGGNAFWNTIGWTRRGDLNSYDFVLNQENITAFIKEGERSKILLDKPLG